MDAARTGKRLIYQIAPTFQAQKSPGYRNLCAPVYGHHWPVLYFNFGVKRLSCGRAIFFYHVVSKSPSGGHSPNNIIPG